MEKCILDNLLDFLYKLCLGIRTDYSSSEYSGCDEFFVEWDFMLTST